MRSLSFPVVVRVQKCDVYKLFGNTISAFFLFKLFIYNDGVLCAFCNKDGKVYFLLILSCFFVKIFPTLAWYLLFIR